MSSIGIFLVGVGVIALALLVLALSDRRAAGPRHPFGKASTKKGVDE